MSWQFSAWNHGILIRKQAKSERFALNPFEEYYQIFHKNYVATTMNSCEKRCCKQFDYMSSFGQKATRR